MHFVWYFKPLYFCIHRQTKIDVSLFVGQGQGKNTYINFRYVHIVRDELCYLICSRYNVICGL